MVVVIIINGLLGVIYLLVMGSDTSSMMFYDVSKMKNECLGCGYLWTQSCVRGHAPVKRAQFGGKYLYVEELVCSTCCKSLNNC